MPDAWLPMILDPGEASTIALALRQKPDALLIDERKGRRIEETVYRLPVIGTGGVLLRAKTRGLIPSVKPLLEAMRRQGYYLSASLADRILRSAGE
ncbi:MAG: DUF3368 domain-containing protein [Opitutaceae bacterium]|nr:DUF3368 domain-containing protein [Opitutaceae bacterium]